MVRRYTLAELPALAKDLLKELDHPRVIALDAPMGAGKTTLVHAICDELMVTDPVGSPTFSIINEYGSASGPVYHIDCYRLKSEEEAVDAGIEECLDGVNWCFIEWAEKIPHLLPQNLVRIHLKVLDPVTRELELRIPAAIS
ncbi:tRNA (adenosine(37)-N6)-threonylcarbamoyltransferase complex ATPase subunit type 1 TsaE [Flavihumibacter sp. UBA7668]|uniref:tRNA (adenosine(37)-N6)-threonylcarbamoyltransferase complex ATPase subunit type 1 TsaE n=1 Tax=Flavihumibacter sp. UBA7668 TaxID=1946542 RepID=UPI0025B8973D|nr:tRNA (adenosine(37)-N6)-threonylcarbamoyltransferase complex ATPase subunit type 1 TsaE [Flavihumibacter sp. UBA7668]